MSLNVRLTALLVPSVLVLGACGTSSDPASSASTPPVDSASTDVQSTPSPAALTVSNPKLAVYDDWNYAGCSIGGITPSDSSFRGGLALDAEVPAGKLTVTVNGAANVAVITPGQKPTWEKSSDSWTFMGDEAGRHQSTAVFKLADTQKENSQVSCAYTSDDGDVNITS